MAMSMKVMKTDGWHRDQYTGIRFLSHAEACRFLWSSDGRRFERMSVPNGPNRFGVKLYLKRISGAAAEGTDDE